MHAQLFWLKKKYPPVLDLGPHVQYCTQVVFIPVREQSECILQNPSLRSPTYN